MHDVSLNDLKLSRIPSPLFWSLFSLF